MHSAREEVSIDNNPHFDVNLYNNKIRQWLGVVGEETQKDEEITKEALREACEIICSMFPRGNKAGELLIEPIVDDTPLELRGISMAWLSRALTWMRQKTGQQSPAIPTRIFVLMFVEPMVQRNGATNIGAEVLPLYYYLPLEFRGPPNFFISHGWESWLRHLLYFPPATSIPGRLAKQQGKAKTFLWLDIFAIVQDPGSPKQQDEVARIGEVVRLIGNTCLIVPGHGSTEFALLPARRSWCCFEIAITPPENLTVRVGFHKSYFEKDYSVGEGIEYHMALISSIERLDCGEAETSNELEKKGINDFLECQIGMEKANQLVREAILRAFEARYSGKGYQTRYLYDRSKLKRSERAQNVAKLYRDAIERFQETCS